MAFCGWSWALLSALNSSVVSGLLDGSPYLLWGPPPQPSPLVHADVQGRASITFVVYLFPQG